MYSELPKHRKPTEQEEIQHYCGSAKPEPEMYTNSSGKLKESGRWLTPSGAVRVRNLMGEWSWYPCLHPMGSVEQMRASRGFWYEVKARLERDVAGLALAMSGRGYQAWTWRESTYGPPIVDGRYGSQKENNEKVLTHLRNLLAEADAALADLTTRITAKLREQYLAKGLTLLEPTHAQYQPELDPTLAR